MAYMVSANLSLHRVNQIEAKSNTKAVLNLRFYGDPDASSKQFNVAEVTVFMEDHEMVKRLVAAINSCQPSEAAPAVEDEDEPAF